MIIFGEANKLKGEKKGLKSLGGEKAVKYTDLMKHNTTITGFDLYPLLEESQIFPPIMDALFTMYQDGIIKYNIHSHSMLIYIFCLDQELIAHFMSVELEMLKDI